MPRPNASATIDARRSGRLVEVERDGVVVETTPTTLTGNRTSWTRGAESGTATYDSRDRLLTYGPLSFTYTCRVRRAIRPPSASLTGHRTSARPE